MNRGDFACKMSENSPSPIGWERAGVRVRGEGRGEGSLRFVGSKRETSSAGILPPPILVCFAMPEEAHPFRRLAAGHADLEILLTGVGQKNAERALRASLARHKPRLVLTCGFAGGLNPELQVGDVLFSPGTAPVLKEELLAAGAREGCFQCADRIAVTAAEKQALRQSVGADAVEMESAVILRICQEEDIPSTTIRVISDAAHEDLPLDFNRLMTPSQRLDPARLALAILNSPGKFPALLRLRRQTRFAAERLAQILAAVFLR